MNMRNSTVTINTDILTSSTQEYILVTMYHEALHAYLNIEEYELGAEQFAQKYPDVSKVQNGDKFEYLAGHNGFGSFIEDLAATIISFNPGISETDALALAKTGIVKPSSMTSEEINTNQKYRDGEKGTKCGNTD